MMTILQSHKLALPCLRRAGRSRSYGGKRIGNDCRDAHNRGAENSAWEVLLKFVDPDPLALRPPCAASAGGDFARRCDRRRVTVGGRRSLELTLVSRCRQAAARSATEGLSPNGSTSRTEPWEGRRRRLNAAAGFSGGAGRCWHCGRRIRRQVDVHRGERVVFSMRGRARSQRSRALALTADAVQAADRLPIVVPRSSLPVPAEVAGEPWVSGRRVTPRDGPLERGRSA